MPGLVVRVQVEAGGTVGRRGPGVVVLEAMKMENELRARPRPARCGPSGAAGEAVEKGQVLVEFERTALDPSADAARLSCESVSI